MHTLMGYLLSGLLLASPFANMNAEEKGRAILLKNEENFDNYGDSTADIKMVIHLGEGKTIARQMQFSMKHVPGDGDKVLMFYDSPADVKGLAILLVSHKFEYDDAWIYLPDRRRIKRISSQNKAGQFMGTQFVFEDLMRLEPEKFDYKFIKEVPCGDQECYELERYCKEASSVYSKQVAWIDKEHFNLQQVQLHDKQGKYVKTMVFKGYRLYDNKFWRQSEMEVVDRTRGFKTRLIYKNWKFDVGLRESLFTVNGLKNMR